MSTSGINPLQAEWLHRTRHIEWELTFGPDIRRRPNVRGEFAVNLAYLNDQGEKWGDDHIKQVGQYYEDYAHWDSVSTFLPVGGAVPSRTLLPNPFTIRSYKDTAPGVTALIGEVLVTILLQNVLKLNQYDMAHLKDDMNAPDMCLDIEPKLIAELLKNSVQVRLKNENRDMAEEVGQAVWDYPLPLECRSRRGAQDRQVREALLRLLNYWRHIPEMAGSGIFAQVDINPETKIRLHLLLPKEPEAENIRSIITGRTQGTDLPQLPQEPTYEQFMAAIGGRLIG